MPPRAQADLKYLGFKFFQDDRASCFLGDNRVMQKHWDQHQIYGAARSLANDAVPSNPCFLCSPRAKVAPTGCMNLTVPDCYPIAQVAEPLRVDAWFLFSFPVP